MVTTQPVQELVKQKLEAFEQLQPEFEVSFPYVQDVHGLKRFPSFPVSNAVRYLHALWICECKDRLLSVYKNISRYEGRECLVLLQGWQAGNTADVVAFLNRKLDMLPFADLTRRIREAEQQGGEDGLAQRLIHGRHILLNRGMNLMQVLDAIFALPEDELIHQAQAACAQYRHRPEEIEKQLADMDSPLYAYAPHSMLAQRNMVVMNKMGVNVTSKPADKPGRRSWRVLEPTVPAGPYAQHIIEGYLELTAPLFNNVREVRFIDHPEPGENIEIQRDVELD